MKLICLLALAFSAQLAIAEDEIDEKNYVAPAEPGANLSKLDEDWTVKDVPLGLYVTSDGSPLIPLVDGAKETVDVEIYEMKDPAFKAALRKAMARGVRVRVVKDPTPLGETCSPFKEIEPKDDAECADSKRLAKEIVEREGAFVPFNKANLCGIPGKSCFQHGKMVIADGKRAMLSSGNFNSSNLCNLEAKPDKCNRDYSFVTGHFFAVRALKKIFERDLKGEPHNASKPLRLFVGRKITVSPFSEKPLIKFLKSAKKTILIENQYLKEKAFNDAMIEMAKKGVEVKVVLASSCAFGPPTEKAKKEQTVMFTEWDSAGIKTRMFTEKVPVRGKPGYMHAKAIVVDGKRAWMGSVNGSDMSMNRNREYGIFFDDEESVGRLAKTIEEDFAHEGGATWVEGLGCVKESTRRSSGGND